jgi:multiple sugar transport system substrate-binding protein
MRSFRWLAILICVVQVVAACGPTQSQPSSATSAPAAATSAPAAGAPTQAAGAASKPAAGAVPSGNLRLMGWSSSPEEDRLLNDTLTDFSKQYPSIQVTFQPVPDYATKLQTDLAAGTAADVFYVDSLLAPDLMKRNLLEPLDDYISRDKVDTSDFYPGLFKAFQWKGKTYGLPKDWSSLAMEWSADAASKAGIDQAPSNWDELRAAAQKLTDKSSGTYGTVIPAELPRFGAFVLAAGGKLVSDDGSKIALNSPEGQQALDFYYGMYKDGIASTPADTGTQWPGDAFIKKKAAIVFEGNWIFPAIKKDAPEMKFNISEMPSGPKGKGTFAFTVSYSINAKTQQKDAAWFLVNYLTGPDGMKKWTSLGLAMPSRKSLESEWLSNFKEREPYLKAGAYAQPWQLGPGGQEINDKIVTPDLQAVFAGKMTTKDALADIEKRGNDILAKQ